MLCVRRGPGAPSRRRNGGELRLALLPYNCVRQPWRRPAGAPNEVGGVVYAPSGQISYREDKP